MKREQRKQEEKLILQRMERMGKIANSIEANSIGCIAQILNILTDRQLEDLDCLWDNRVIKIFGKDYICEGLVPIGRLSGKKLLKLKDGDIWNKANTSRLNKYGRQSITGWESII